MAPPYYFAYVYYLMIDCAQEIKWYFHAHMSLK
jgi:hypothetical protein